MSKLWTSFFQERPAVIHTGKLPPFNQSELSGSTASGLKTFWWWWWGRGFFTLPTHIYAAGPGNWTLTSRSSCDARNPQTWLRMKVGGFRQVCHLLAKGCNSAAASNDRVQAAREAPKRNTGMNRQCQHAGLLHLRIRVLESGSTEIPKTSGTRSWRQKPP